MNYKFPYSHWWPDDNITMGYTLVIELVNTSTELSNTIWRGRFSGYYNQGSYNVFMGPHYHGITHVLFFKI